MEDRFFITIKTGYYATNSGWRYDIFQVITISNGECMSYNVKVGYEGIFPIENALKVRGFKQLHNKGSIYGRIKPSEYRGYEYSAIEDILEYYK